MPYTVGRVPRLDTTGDGPVTDAMHPGGVDAHQRRASCPPSGCWRSGSPACDRVACRARPCPAMAYGAAQQPGRRRQGRRGQLQSRMRVLDTRSPVEHGPARFRRRRSRARRPSLQHGEIAGTALAETELRPDPDFAGAQALDQQRLRRNPRPTSTTARALKRSRPTQSTPSARRPSNFSRGSIRRGGGSVAGEELARQRLEAQRHRRQAQVARTRDGAADQRPMARDAGRRKRRCRPRCRAGTSASPSNVTEQPAHGLKV